MGSPSTDRPRRKDRTFTAAEIATVVGRSSTLAERLAGEVIPTGRGLAVAAERLDRWKRLAASRDAGPVPASDEELLRLFGEVTPAPGSALPRWAAVLKEIVPAVSAAFSAGEELRLSPGAHRSIPFAALYLPAVAWARKQVGSIASGHREWMHAEAWRGLEDWLLRRISAVCSLALQPRFLAYKAVRLAGATPVRFGKNPPARDDGRAGPLFDAFVREQGRRGLRDFFMDYPTAARLTAQAILFWIDAVVEFLGRLEADAGESLPASWTGAPPENRAD